MLNVILYIFYYNKIVYSKKNEKMVNFMLHIFHHN